MSARTIIRGLCAVFSALALGLTGCDRQNEFVPNRQIDAAIAAVVNEQPIYRSDVELEAIAQGFITPGEAFGDDHPQYQKVLDQLIDQRLLAQEALRRGLDNTTDARRRLEAGRERLLGNILVESLVASEVTETAIDTMYEEQVKLQQLDDEVRVRHLLVSTQAQADTILAEIMAGRAFTDAALEYSEDVRTRLEGGDLGWVSPNALPDPFPAVIGDTETSGVSYPFVTERGWHILKVDERRTRPPKTRDEMRPEIVTFLTFTQISDILSDLRAGANIRMTGFDAATDRTETPQTESVETDSTSTDATDTE